jgi:hypothetical protein
MLLAALLAAETAFAQKPGGILQMPGFASPASMSIHEESTIAAGIPLMGVFNNLVLFDQHVAQNSLASIVSDLASDWAWGDRRGADLSLASGRQMARRHAVHRRGRQMHLGRAGRQGEREVPGQSPQVLVPQSR